MPKRVWVCVLWISCVLALVASSMSGACRGDEPPKEPAEQFRLEYPAASKKLEHFYTHMAMSARLNCRRPVAKGEFTDFVIKTDGASIRRDNTKSADAFASVFVYDPAISFGATRKSAAAKYSFMWKERLAQDDFDECVRGLRRQSLACAAPYCTMFGEPIAKMVSGERFVLLGASRVADPAGDLVKIDWKCPFPDGRRQWGSFVFAPGDCWALMRAILHADAVVERTGVIFEHSEGMDVEYSGNEGGVPLVRQVRTWGFGNAVKVPLFDFDVKSLIPGAVPRHEFTPEILGLRPDAAP